MSLAFFFAALIAKFQRGGPQIKQEEVKVLRAQMELSTIRQEIDRRIHEKEEEFENTRRNHARTIESMQASLEAESRTKAEVLKQVI